MANPALEKFILKFAAVLVLIAGIVLLLVLPRKLLVLTALLVGFAISILLFLSTAMLFGNAAKKLEGKGDMPAVAVFLAFVVMLLALYFFMKLDTTGFWVLVGGICAVPAAVICYILLEAFGVLHTGFFT